MTPFVYDLLDEEQQKQAQGQQAAEGAPAFTGGGESFAGGDGSAQVKTDQPGAQKGANRAGSGFVNLDKYMAANKGSDFGNQFTGKIQGSVDSAKQDLDKNSGEFASASNQGTTRWNDVGDEITGIVDRAGKFQAQGQAPAEGKPNINPVGSTGPVDPAKDTQRFNQIKNARYTGPESFTGSAYGAQAQGGITKATQEAGAAQTEGGRFALLDQLFGRPTYSMGEKALDNLLVQNTKGSAAKTQALGNQAKQLSATGAQTSQDMDTLATSNRFATEEASKKARDTVSGAVTGLKSDLDGRFSTFKTQEGERYKRLSGDVADDQLESDTLQALGLNADQTLYGANLADYVRPHESSISEFADEADYARSLALAELAGEDSFLRSEDRAKAGTAKNVRVDRDRLGQDLSRVDSEYKAKIQEATSADRAELAQVLADNGDNPPLFTVQHLQNKIRQTEEALAAQYGANRKAKLASRTLNPSGGQY